MALDYYEVMPHKITLLGKNFTYGRNGHKIQRLVRHHTAGVLDAAALNRVWQNRPASTHYLIDPQGIVSQHVWDNNAAWANAHWQANQDSLSMEHSNNAGAPGWPISDETIIGGARWGAALNRFYDLGRPKFNGNVNDHRQFTSTSCPHHLHDPGGKYSHGWFEEATWFYDQLQKKLVDAQGNPIKQNFPAPKPAPTQKKGLFMHLSEAEEREILTKVREIHSGLLKPVPSLVEGSTFEAPRVDMIDLIDRKVEELHVEYHGKPSVTQRECDEHAKADAEHDPADEDHHAVDEEAK